MTRALENSPSVGSALADGIPASHEARSTASSFTPLWTLYTLTLRQHLRGKRWLVASLLYALPAILILIIRATAPTGHGLEFEFIFAFMFIPQALLPLVALLYASGMIQDEQEEQTITYLLIRPIPKWALYAVKLLATLTTTVTLTALFTALTYAAIYARGVHEPFSVASRCLTAVYIHCLAAIAYCCLFALISLLTKRALVYGILYIALIEGLLANLPLSVRLITVIYYARAIAFRNLPFVITLPPMSEQNIAADTWHFDLFNDPALLEHPTTLGAIKTLLFASLALAAVGTYLCSRREFHVKTPEKS